MKEDRFTPAVRLKGVRKSFGTTAAVVDLDLEIARGGLYGFIGPNGAGKTTSIRMIMSILFPDAGELAVLGRASALEAKDRIGYLPEERGIYRRMRVGAFLTYMGRLKGIADAELQTRVPRALERVGLAGVERKRCQELSKGMSQKVQFLAAILHEPELLILDEPFSGLDPVSTRQLRELILAEHARGATVLFSTHVMPHAEEICDHVIMIHRGRKVLDESVAALRQRYDPRTIYFEPLNRRADLSPIGMLSDVEQIGGTGKTHEIVLRAGADPAIVVPRIAAAVAPARLELARPRLEDIFIQIVTEAGAGEDERGLRADLREEGDGVVAV